jgi:hypothetical protein
MKRRTLLAGIGALASGSGAIATSAAISGTVNTASSLTVVVEQDLEAKAGLAFNDDGSVKNSYSEQYVPYPTNTSFFQEQSNPLDDINREDVPVGTVSPRNTTVNDELELKVALSIENNINTFIFENFLQIENNGGTEQNVGIRYDRENDAYDPNGQYGEDVVVGGDFENDLSQHDVQHIFRFKTNDPGTGGEMLISPDPTGDSDAPNESRQINPGNSIQVNLDIKLTELQYRVDIIDETFTLDPKENIENAVDTTNGFGDSITTVDLLDGITIENE